LRRLLISLAEIADEQGDLCFGLADLAYDRLPAGVAPAAGAAGDGIDVGRLVESKALDGQLVAVQAGGYHALEGAWGVLEADEGAHHAVEADLMAVAEQVVAGYEGVAERGRLTGRGGVDKVGFDLDGGDVQDGDVVGVGGGEGGETQGGGEQGGEEDEHLPASRHGNLFSLWRPACRK
jgi:hypothetical protein